MQLNKKMDHPALTTHEGGPAKKINPEKELRRTVLCCLLWENNFYEEGMSIAARIAALVPQVEPIKVAMMAAEVRGSHHLRHVPLLIAVEMLKHPEHKKLVSKVLNEIIQRPDELTEFLAVYWKDGKRPIAAQAKKGLAAAFTKFKPYQLAKYNRDKAIKLRDVLFLCHAKPLDEDQVIAFKQLADNTLPVPDTWEVALSGGADKKETFIRLLSEGKLGGLALLRNLRNMMEAGVDKNIIIDGLDHMKTDRILPYRFIAAAKYAPDLEPWLEKAMFKCIDPDKKLTGSTLLLVDVSGSMTDPLSGNSDLTRIDAACGLAMLLREMSDDFGVCTFSDNLISVPPRRGFALRDVINNSQSHYGTQLGSALKILIHNNKQKFDRMIVITDEQTQDRIPDPIWKHSYIINVSTHQHGVGYGKWTHIDGFSEGVTKYIREIEIENAISDIWK